MRDLSVKYYDIAKAGHFRGLYCGLSKAGKTHLLGTYPNPLIIDTDNGGRTLKDLHIPFISYSVASLREPDLKLRPQPYEEIRYIIGRLIINKGKIWIESNPAEGEAAKLWFDGEKEGYHVYEVKTLGFDSITMLSTILLNEAAFDVKIGETTNRTGKRDLAVEGASFAEYRVVATRLQEIFDMTKDLDFMEIAGTVGIDGKLNEKGEWTLSQFPDIDGKFRAMIPNYFDTVALLEKDPMKPDIYWMRTHSHKFSVGTRDRLPAQIENPTYAKIIGGMKNLANGVKKV